LFITLSGLISEFLRPSSHVGRLSASKKKHFPDSTTLSGTFKQSPFPYFDIHQAVVKCASSSGELPGGDAIAQLAEIQNDKTPTIKAVFNLDFMIAII
jgi:hypothetical protein